MSHVSSLGSLLRREWLLATRRKGEYLYALGFFLLLGSLFPLAAGPTEQSLSLLAPVVIWIAALLASLLCLDALFKNDHAEGTLEQIILLGEPLYLVVLVKVLVHWLASGAPLLLLGPVLGFMLYLPEAAFLPLCLSLLLGTPVLSLVGAIGAALVVVVKRDGMLIALLVLPLYAPVLILAIQAVQHAALGQDVTYILLMLGAFLALAITLGPFAITQGLKAVYLS